MTKVVDGTRLGPTDEEPHDHQRRAPERPHGPAVGRAAAPPPRPSRRSPPGGDRTRRCRCPPPRRGCGSSTSSTTCAAYNVPAALRLRGPLDAAALLRRRRATSRPGTRCCAAVIADERRRLGRRRAAVPLDGRGRSTTATAGRRGCGRRRPPVRPGPRAARCGPCCSASPAPTSTCWRSPCTTSPPTPGRADLLLAELAALYAARLGLAAPPAPPPVQYADYAAWQRRAAGGATWTGGATRLAGLPPSGPADRPAPRRRSPTCAGARRPVRLAPALTADGSARCAAETGCTPFMVLLAAWQALLAGSSGTADVAGRRARGRPAHAGHRRAWSAASSTRSSLRGRPVAATRPAASCWRRARDAGWTRSPTRTCRSSGSWSGCARAEPGAPRRCSRCMLNVLDDRPQAGAARPDAWSTCRLPLRDRQVRPEAGTSSTRATACRAGEFVYSTDLFDAATVGGWPAGT